MLFALLLSLVAGDSPKVEPDKDELKHLQGKWIVAENEHGGKKSPAKELANLSMEVKASKMTTRDGNEVKEETTILKVDTKAKPAEIDLKIASGPDIGKVVKAIYKVAGDSLTICFAEPGKDRPTAFEGKEKTGHTLMVFKKTK